MVFPGFGRALQKGYRYIGRGVDIDMDIDVDVTLLTKFRGPFEERLS